MAQKINIIPTLKHWLSSHREELDALVFDIDGVLLVKGRAAPGSRELLALLRKEKMPFYLLTNDGDHSTWEKSEILNASGIDVHSEEIVSCADGLVELFRGKKPSLAPFFIMGNLGTPCFAEKAGLSTTRNLDQIDQCQGIIVGEKGYDWEPAINAAVNFFVKKPQAPLIVPNPDEYYPGNAGQLCIGAGGVGRFISHVLESYGIKVAPFYLGKPFAPIFKKTHALLEQRYGRQIVRNRVLMTGDFIKSDVQGALNFGYRSALVLTGVTTAEMVEKSHVRPDLVFQALG
ncbi:HAD-IIA family hydrolase [Desulfocicer niacini]